MASINVSAMVNYAKTFVGKPYVYSGIGGYSYCTRSHCPVHKKGVKYYGYDCSGFVTTVTKKYGIIMPRTTSSMQSWNPGKYGKKLGGSTPIKKGDVILFNGHVAMAVSSTEMIHSPICGKTICIVNFANYKRYTKKYPTKIFRFNDSGGTSTSDTKPKTKEEQCFEFFRKKGCSVEAACGILGNIKGESGFSTTIVNPKSKATGLFQWLGSRLTSLKKKASNEGRSWTSLSFQLEYAWYEFTGSECKYWMDKWGSVDKFKKLKNVETATLAWEKIFERSGGQGNSLRIRYAKEFYSKFKNYTISSDNGSSNDDKDDTPPKTTVVVNNIIHSPTSTVTQMKNWAKSKKATSTFINNAQYYYTYGKRMGVNPTLAYAQYAWESNYGHYKEKLPSSNKNTCGIKNSDKSAYAKFSSWEKGIEAHIDHLGLYAGGINYPKNGSTDPRHFMSYYGKYRTVNALGGAWSSNGESYSSRLKTYMKEIQLSAGGSSSTSTEGTKPSAKGKKIFLDPGHGGTDSGALGNNLIEKDVNLAVALKIKKFLEDRGATVRMSRQTDMAVNLQDRVSQANSWGADCYLSVHCNSASSSSARGVETFYYKSSTLADSIQTQITKDKSLYGKNNGVKNEDFYVIRETKMMSALVELAFITNSSDAAILKDKQEGLALACAKGIIQYLGCNWEIVDKKPAGWEQGAVGKYDPATKYIGQVYNTSSLNVRSGAGTSNSIITTLSKGNKVNVYSVLSNGWLRVKTPNGKIGYASGNYIKKVADAPKKPEEETKKYMYYVYPYQSSSKFECETELAKIKKLGYSNAKINSRSL